MWACVRCAPPDDKPAVVARDTCAPWIQRGIELVAPGVRVVVALGGYGWDATLRSLRAAGWEIPRPKPKFGHGAQVVLNRPGGGDRVTLLGCYHPSQHNTFTGRPTDSITDQLQARARTTDSLPPCPFTTPAEPP